MTAGARAWIDWLFDAFDELDSNMPDFADPLLFPGYREASARAASESGRTEAVVAGIGRIGQHEVAAAVFEFGFLGGSMGIRVGDSIAAAMAVSEDQRIPFVAVTASGGARMQEGMTALSQMPRLVAASERLGAAGIPRITILANPTTGGVYASFASLADFLLAERGATIGFAGPRVAEALTGEALPSGSHTAEAAYAHGLVDFAGDPEQISEALRSLLDCLAPGSIDPGPVAASPPEISADPPKTQAWQQYSMARDPRRPTPRAIVQELCEILFEIHGDRSGHDDPSTLAGIGRIGGRPAVIAAFDRMSPDASGYRKTRRAVQIAGRLGLPLLTLVDTPGADPSFSSEYGGLAGEISRTFASILSCPSPVLSVVTGEGGSGGALALCCGDRIAVCANSVFSVISPEGAATILYRDAARAPEVAGLLKPTAADLMRLGIADDLLGEEDLVESVRAWTAYWIQNAAASPHTRAFRFERAGRS